MFLRENQEQFEKAHLSSRAALSATALRERPIEKCTVRTEFQRDRDRIIHTRAFRRLKGKTQVFISPKGDHYRTRLTHTLEVSQISRTISRALLLNEDLTEAIAMGHDLGHTPFGHTGEFVLDRLVESGFCHYLQSLRVVEVIEDLNLTKEVRDGIRGHSGGAELPNTLEGQIVRIADRIAYINHDIDDAIRSGILSETDLPREFIQVLGKTHGERINAMVSDMIRNSWEKDLIQMSPEMEKATLGIRTFLFENFYLGPFARAENAKAQHVVESLYQYYLKNPDKIPSNGVKYQQGEELHKVVDFVAGMTDRYAMEKYEDVFLPKPWTFVTQHAEME